MEDFIIKQRQEIEKKFNEKKILQQKLILELEKVGDELMHLKGGFDALLKIEKIWNETTIETKQNIACSSYISVVSG